MPKKIKIDFSKPKKIKKKGVLIDVFPWKVVKSK
jgi:hypothetical protein